MAPVQDQGQANHGHGEENTRQGGPNHHRSFWAQKQGRQIVLLILRLNRRESKPIRKGKIFQIVHLIGSSTDFFKFAFPQKNHKSFQTWTFYEENPFTGRETAFQTEQLD